MEGTGRAVQVAEPLTALGLKDRALPANRSLAEPVPNTTAPTAFGPCLMVRNSLLQQKSPAFPEEVGNAKLLHSFI